MQGRVERRRGTYGRSRITISILITTTATIVVTVVIISVLTVIAVITISILSIITIIVVIVVIFRIWLCYAMFRRTRSLLLHGGTKG